jgi:hypothetical protein
MAIGLGVTRFCLARFFCNAVQRPFVKYCHPERRPEPRLRGEGKRGAWVLPREATLRRQEPRALDKVSSRDA